ncbi:MAG: PDDEXK nuclease domain-containing protein [Anaerolineales bacterium]
MKFSDDEIRKAADRLRPFLAKILASKEDEYALIQASKDEVLARFQPIFSLQNIPSLTLEDYRSFLIFNNNRHWKSLQRMGPYHTADMKLLRKALGILLDENRPIKERLDLLLPPSGPMVPRFGAATITPIMLIAYPDKYGVLNKPAEDGLRAINLWPEFKQGAAFSEKYLEANQIYLALIKVLGIDLWTLDNIWWAILLDNISIQEKDTSIPESPDELERETQEIQRFGLERSLQDFLRDNWDRIPQLNDWSLYEEDGDQVGFEFNTNKIGRIDLLAHHKREPRWLVIELKRDQGSDQTVGQVLRYMGWVDKHLKKTGEDVQGLIICQSLDTGLQYALGHAMNVTSLLYEVQFSLREPK